MKRHCFLLCFFLAVAVSASGRSGVKDGSTVGGYSPIKNLTDPHVIEVSPWASKATLDIIGVAGLGREFNMLRRSADPLLDVYEELLEPATEKLLFSAASFALGIRFIKLLPWKMNNLFDYLSRRLNEICIPMMKQKKTMIEQSKDGNFDVLSLLIKSGNFTDSELKDQLLTFQQHKK